MHPKRSNLKKVHTKGSMRARRHIWKWQTPYYSWMLILSFWNFLQSKVIFDTTSLTSKFGRFFYFEDVFLGLLRRSIYLSRFLFVAISYKGIRTYRYLTFSHLFTWICSILQNVICTVTNHNHNWFITQSNLSKSRH